MTTPRSPQTSSGVGRDVVKAGPPANIASSKYQPRLVCNMYYWAQMFASPHRYIVAKGGRLQDRHGRGNQVDPSMDGIIWSREQWNSALAEARYAGYSRLEIMSETVMAEPIENLIALLRTHRLVINHIWHGGALYPSDTREETLARTIEVLEASQALGAREIVFDPFVDRAGPSRHDMLSQNRGLERVGREARDRGIRLCVHNHESAMRNSAEEWFAVLNTDPELVAICLDLDWAWQAGVDPLPLLYRVGDEGRLGAVHLRTQHGRITDQTMEDGGDIDFGRVAGYLKRLRFNGLLIEETEVMRDTLVTRSVPENKRIAREWCERVFGVLATR